MAHAAQLLLEHAATVPPGAGIPHRRGWGRGAERRRQEAGAVERGGMGVRGTSWGSYPSQEREGAGSGAGCGGGGGQGQGAGQGTRGRKQG